MQMKIILLFLSLVTFIYECKSDSTKVENLKSLTEENLISNSPQNDGIVESGLKEELITQEVRYYAPQSQNVFLAWRVENFTLENSVIWNVNTKITDGLLYNPMVSNGDTFKIEIRVPIGAKFEYYFWTTFNKSGQYYDFWDIKSGGKKIIDNSSPPIIKNAQYSKTEEKKTSPVIKYGWLLMIILTAIYALLYWIQKWIPLRKKTDLIEKVIFLGLSLIAFHALARSVIINYNIINILHNPGGIAKIIRASFDDIIFVSILVAIFTLILFLLKNSNIRKIVFGIFIFLALLSTLIAFTNITTVIYLGKPFTYQWLYYSDFLGSNEAKTALQENLSIGIIVNLIFLCLSMLLFADILGKLYVMMKIQKPIKLVFFSIFGLVFMILFVKAINTKVSWTKGQAENAISTMVYSVFASGSNSSLFNTEIPKNTEPFNPAKAEKAEFTDYSLANKKVDNVLFIILESSGASYFDAFGGQFQISPNLNKYESKSLIFNQMYAHAPATNLSLVSILGSMYPHLSYKSLTQETPDIVYPTISSELKQKGYRTSFFSSSNLNFQNCKQFLEHRDFDIIEDFSKIKCDDQFQLYDSENGNGINDMCLLNRLTSWLDEDTAKNFFSMIWTVQGHYPYYFTQKEEEFGVSNYNFNRYLNCLKHDDELIGRVMQALEERGLDSTTLVIVVGDHGEAFGQHNQYGHGTGIYEENLRVPLYFINSTLFHGTRKNDVAGMKDLATTVFSILNFEAPKIWQGRDLLKTNSYENFFFAPWSDYLFGYRKDNMKFIFNESQNKVEVYDLVKDPQEEFNLMNSISKEELNAARNRLAEFVQFQDNFIKEITKK